MRQIGSILAYYTKKDWPSHHFLCDFTVKGISFSSMEQMLMYSKAMFFKDEVNAKRILSTDLCQAQKMIGRDVSPFNKEEWDAKSPQIAFIGGVAKYRHNPHLLRLLLATDQLTLVEASKNDTLWGIGLSEDDPRVADPTQWRGENRHGNVQMKIRDFFVANPQLLSDDEFKLLVPENLDPFSRRREGM